jgi:hypothetical protein
MLLSGLLGYVNCAGADTGAATGRRCMTDQTKAFFLASQEKVSPKPFISFQFYIKPSPLFTLEKKIINTVN